jgi:hypothetical protein
MSEAMSNEARSPRGLKGDIHRAREGAKASAAELRQFVADFRGKAPQEMLGMVAGSGLVQGTIVATIVTVLFMAGFTVGPYVWKKSAPPVAKKSAPAAEAPKPAAPAAAAPAAAPAGNAPATAAANPAAPGPSGAPSTGGPGTAAPGAGPGGPEVLNRLGVGETKTADPKKNPLENSADDLLKDLK